MQQIPLQPIPAQITKVVVGGQNCQLSIRQTGRGLFVDINANGEDLAAAAIARDAVPLISREYVGFSGNFLFIDTQGKSDPSYTGLGSRFALVYLTADEYAVARK